MGKHFWREGGKVGLHEQMEYILKILRQTPIKILKTLNSVFLVRNVETKLYHGARFYDVFHKRLISERLVSHEKCIFLTVLLAFQPYLIQISNMII